MKTVRRPRFILRGTRPFAPLACAAFALGSATLALGCAALALGCAATRPPSTTLAQGELEARDLQRLRRAAPDLVAQAEAAEARVREADARGDATAAHEHLERLRLLLEAARVVGDASALEAEHDRLLARARDAEGHALDAEKLLEAAVKENQRRAAVNLAKQEAEKAFLLAEAEEATRLRAKAGAPRGEVEAAAKALVARARLLLLAAVAMGASPEERGAVEVLLRRAETGATAGEALGAADAAVLEALRVLGAVRRKRAEPTAEERAALIEAATAYGFSVEARPAGLVVERRGALAAKARERLVALLLAHPHGNVLVGGPKAEVDRLVALATGKGVPATRLVRAAEGPPTEIVTLTFVAMP